MRINTGREKILEHYKLQDTGSKINKNDLLHNGFSFMKQMVSE